MSGSRVLVVVVVIAVSDDVFLVCFGIVGGATFTTPEAATVLVTGDLVPASVMVQDPMTTSGCDDSKPVAGNEAALVPFTTSTSVLISSGGGTLILIGDALFGLVTCVTAQDPLMTSGADAALLADFAR